jgi:hypothetical protein
VATHSGRLLAALISTSVIVCAPSAFADESATQTPFEEAKALMKQERYGEAIPKLLLSIGQEKSVGALFNLGVCYESLHRPASAWVRFKEAEAVAHDKADAREVAAAARARALEPHLSRIVVSVPAAADLPALEVKRDGAVLPRSEWGIRTPVDPGAHSIEARAPGKKPWSAQVTARDSGGDVSSVVVGPLADLESARSASAPANGPSRAPDNSHGPGAQKIGGIAAVSAGAVGLGLGVFMALGAKSKNSDSKAHCLNPNDPNACDAVGVGLRNDAKSSADIATVAFIAGGVALAAGAALWFTSPRSRTTVGIAPNGLGVKGVWTW